jgi:hypothetical protein
MNLSQIDSPNVFLTKSVNVLTSPFPAFLKSYKHSTNSSVGNWSILFWNGKLMYRSL